MLRKKYLETKMGISFNFSSLRKKGRKYYNCGGHLFLFSSIGNVHPPLSHSMRMFIIFVLIFSSNLGQSISSLSYFGED